MDGRVAHLNLHNNKLTSCSELDFFTPIGIYTLAETMTVNKVPQLQTLILSDNDLTSMELMDWDGHFHDECLIRLFKGLEAVQATLTHLDISRTGLGREGVHIVVDALSKTPYQLQHLSLSGNYFDTEGTRALAGCISRCIAWLWLSTPFLTFLFLFVFAAKN